MKQKSIEKQVQRRKWSLLSLQKSRQVIKWSPQDSRGRGDKGCWENPREKKKKSPTTGDDLWTPIWIEFDKNNVLSENI